MSLRKALPLLLTALLAGCQAQLRHSETFESEGELSFLAATRAWEVVLSGRVVGSVVEFAEGAQGRNFFSVRNARQQELGMVDLHGRAWRFRPHAEEPEWLGTGTVLAGTRGILELDTSPELVEVALDLLESPVEAR